MKDETRLVDRFTSLAILIYITRKFVFVRQTNDFLVRYLPTYYISFFLFVNNKKKKYDVNGNGVEKVALLLSEQTFHCYLIYTSLQNYILEKSSRRMYLSGFFLRI